MATGTIPFNYKVNRNLVDNWYFGGGGTGDGVFPVNQRGQTSYTGTVYGPDRWKGGNNQSVMELVSGGLKISTDGGYRTFIQPCDNATKANLAGKTGTISVIEDGVLYTATGTFGTRFDAVGAKYSYAVYTEGNQIVRIGGGADGAAVISAIKVELGDTQTLAHYDGGWVLNEIPDFATELAKCQRYFVDLSYPYHNAYANFGMGIATSTTTIAIQFYLPVTMANNTTTLSSTGTFRITNTIKTTNLALSRVSGNVVEITATTGANVTTGMPYAINADANASSRIYISAEL